MLDHGVVKEIERIGPNIGTDRIEPVLKDPVAQRGPYHLQADGVDRAVAEDGVVEIGEEVSEGVFEIITHLKSVIYLK